MGEAAGSIIQRIIRLIPILMIGLLIMGIVLFIVTSVVPHLRQYETLNQQVSDAQTAIAPTPDSGSNDNLVILQQQLDSAQTDLKKAASIFMSPDQAEQIITTMYGYAKDSGVQITTLQAQQPAAGNTNSGASQANQTPVPASVDPYHTLAFRLQVDGTIPQLLGFITHIREAQVAGMIITNVNLNDSAGQESLTMDLLTYSSPFSAGEAYLNLPTIEIPPGLTVVQTTSQQSTVSGTPAPGASASGTPEATTEPLPTEPPLTLLLNDTFDSGDLSHWHMGVGWHLGSDAGGQVLQVDNSPSDLTLAYNTLQDVAVQAQVWLQANGIRVNLLQSAAGRYAVTLDSVGVIALYRGSDLIQSAIAGPSGVSRWRTLRVSAVQGIIRVSVDGVEVIHVADKAELPPGAVSLAMTGTGTVRLDNVEVWALPSGKSS